MAGTATPIFPQTIKNYVTQIVNADASNLKTILTGAANGTLLNRIWVCSNGSSARDLQFYVTIGGTDYLIGTLSIPASSGFTNAVPQVGVFESTQFPSMFLDNNGNKVMRIESGAILKVKALTTVTSAKAISIFCQGGEF